MTQTIASPAVTINNNPVYIVPNSLAFSEGLGEQTVRTQSAGGGVVETLYSEDIESKFSMVKFSMRSTDENIDTARGWKTNSPNNVVAIASTSGSFTRNFLSMSLTGNYEVTLSADGDFELEFQGSPATV